MADDLQPLRALSVAELTERANETKGALFTTRFALRTGRLSDFSKVRALRRDYARIQTVISEKRLAAAKQGAA